MEIKEFMDLKQLQSLQDQFSNATGLAAIAVDAAGNYITRGSNFTDFCMKYTRGCEEGARRCQKCDAECSGTYYCHAGLMDFSSDIVVKGEKVGAMIGGQVLPGEPDEEKFRKIAEEFQIPPERYLEALKKVPVRSEKSIYAAAELLGELVNKVVNLEYYKYTSTSRLDILTEEIGNATQKVEQINQRTKELEGIASKQKILALNASIESARAGAVGAGFTVVASQMEDLSKKSVVIYHQIQSLAGEIGTSIFRMKEMEK